MLEHVKEFVSAFKIRRKSRRLTLEEYAAKQLARGVNPDGTPMLDPVPMAPPIGYKKQPSMVEIVRDMVRGERLAQEAAAAGAETFEESEDFDVGDDVGMPASPWANDFDPSVADARLAVDTEKRLREERRKERFEYFEDREMFRSRKVGGEGGVPPSKGASSAPRPSEGSEASPRQSPSGPTPTPGDEF